jgi:protein ImuB
MRFPSGVVDVRLEVEWIAAGAEQMGLFAERPRRDLEAANRALARVRAQFGEAAVSAARLREAHLPEARFSLEPMERLPQARPRKVRMPPLVRRILPEPEAIPRLRGEGRGTASGHRIGGIVTSAIGPASPPAAVIDPMIPGGLVGLTIPGTGVIEEAIGPYVVAGGWWRRPVVRRYWYVRVEPNRPAPPPGPTRSKEQAGSWLWIYHDPRRRRWFRQGEVE